MPMSVTYTNFGGQLVHENRGGTESFYTSDPLGSIVDVRNSSGTQTFSASYWPYGEIRTSTGTNPSQFDFDGALGYYRENANRAYVRARFLRKELARWMTVDPLWPNQLAFCYSLNRPLDVTDASGMGAVLVVACGVACGACVACTAAWCGHCGLDPECWVACLRDFLEHAPPWQKFVCGAACAGCLACLIAFLISLWLPVCLKLCGLICSVVRSNFPAWLSCFNNCMFNCFGRPFLPPPSNDKMPPWLPDPCGPGTPGPGIPKAAAVASSR